MEQLREPQALAEVCETQARIIRNLRWRVGELQYDLDESRAEIDSLRATVAGLREDEARR